MRTDRMARRTRLVLVACRTLFVALLTSAAAAAAAQADASAPARSAFSAFSWFAIGGAVLVLAALFVLLSSKRRAHRRQRQGAGLP